MITEPIDITQFLPHREPFLMVDWIGHIDRERVETSFVIRQDNIFLDANGIFQESGLVENAAQTCATIVAQGYYRDAEGNVSHDAVDVIGFISAIKTLKIHQLPTAGSQIKTVATLISQYSADTYDLCTMNCQTTCGEQLLLEGEINLFIQQR